MSIPMWGFYQLCEYGRLTESEIQMFKEIEDIQAQKKRKGYFREPGQYVGRNNFYRQKKAN